MIPLTREIWQATKTKMLPTPDKFHYIFNLRDLSRIWQGILKGVSDTCNDTGKFLNIWRHECSRVIADRFTNINDSIWFQKKLEEKTQESLGDSVFGQMSPEPYFVDFLRDAEEPTGEEDGEEDLEAPKIYECIESLEQLEDRLKLFQDQYNETQKTGKMGLVFFKDAMCYLVRISRIIRTDRGHALLVGVGGSGKQCLTRLASFIEEVTLKNVWK